MESRTWRTVGLAIVVIAAAVFVLWRVRASVVEPAAAARVRAPASPSAEDVDDAAPEPDATEAPSPRRARDLDEERAAREDVLVDDAPALDARPRAQGAIGTSIFHGVDPCEPVTQPEIPAEFDSVTAQDVTIAWPMTVQIAEPTLLAHTAAGLLEEAALLTDSDRRARLTIFLHPTLKELRELPRAPKWAVGLYNGAVHVVAAPTRDFGVRIDNLRHEIMHAQLHVAAGCMPAWFDEGTAMLFAGRPPTSVWKRMMREHEALPFDALAIPSVANSKLDEKSVDLAYAQSLAMVLYIQEHSSDGRLDGAVQLLRGARREVARKTAIDLWSTLQPNVTTGDLRDWLTRRVFGLDPSDSVSSLFDGGVCCDGERSVGTFACRKAPLHGDDVRWIGDGGASCSVAGY